MTLIFCCGLFNVALAIFHIGFWRIFNWQRELHLSSVSTRAIIQIANLRLIYLFLFVAFLCFAYPAEILRTPLGRAFLIGMGIFWFGRLVEQFIFLRYNKPMIHILTGIFALGTVLHFAAIF